MNKRALNHFFSKQAPQSEGSTKKAKYRLMHLFAVGILSVQMLTSAVAPVYQVAAETTTQTSQTTEIASTEQTKPTTASEPAASSAEAKTTSESSTEPAEETDPAKVRSDLLKTIAQFGDTAGTTVTVADKAIKIELSPKLSKKAEEIKKAITPLVPDGYKAEITAKQADLQSITNLDQLTTADIKSLTMTWSQKPDAATTTGTAVYPTGFVLTFNSFENGRTATWKPGDTITIPNLTYTGAYGDVSLEPNFVRTTIAGLGYIEGNTITVTSEDIGKELAINFGNLKKSDFASFTTDVKLPAKADVTASFLGQELKFTAIDQSASWTGQIGEVVKDGEVPGERDFSFQYSGSFFTGDKSRDLSYGAAYHDAADFSAYVNKVNDETKDYQGIYPLEPTMKKLAETPGNLFMVNTYPATEANKKILTVTGSNLFTKSTVGAISGLTNDGLHPMVGGEGSSLFLVNTTTRYFEPGTTKAEMKAALAVGETGYSKQADGSFISLVNMGNYSSDGDHISYADVSYPNSLWPAMIRNQHMQPADSFNATDYQAKMVAADGAETPPLFAAQYLSTITVEDPSDGTTTYDLNSTIEGMDDAPVNGTSSVYTPMKMDPATISTEGLAAIKISYKSGDTIVGQSKTIYAEPGTTFDAYKQSSPNEVFFPDEFKVDPFTYRKTAEPTIKDFGAVGTTTNIVVEYEPLATLQLNYKAGDKTIAGSKLIYDVGDTNLKDYLTANADSETNSEAKLFPKEIKNGTTTYRLKDSFDPAAHTFGAGGSMTSVDVEYEKLSDIGFWTPHEGYDLTKNTGTYGDTGLELYVSSEDPWQDKIIGDPTLAENKTEVKAKGIFGNTVDVGAKWYISMDGVLHIGPGETFWVYTSNFPSTDITPPDGDYKAGAVSPWYQYKDKFTKVSIDGKVTLNPTSQYLFSTLDQVTSYSGLENLDFTLDNDYLKENASQYTTVNVQGMFQSNYALTEMTGEENWDLSKVENTSVMFSNTVISSLDATNWGMDSLTNAYAMFYHAKGLTEINGTENWSMAKVTRMDDMFNGASSLKTLDASGWKTGNVTTMLGMFSGTSALTSVETSNWNTSNVTTMSGMFNGAKVLTNVDTSNWDTSKVTSMSVMFQNASSLPQLDTSGWNTSSVTNMSYMFNGASSLTALDTSGWQTPKVTTMRTMFQNTAALTKVDFSSASTSSVTDMKFMFGGTSGLREITFGTEFKTTQLTTDSQAGQLDLPNDTATLKWRDVAGGTVTAPLGSQQIGAYNSATATPDTFVLVDTVSDAKIRYNDVNDTDPLTTTKATQTVNGKVGEPELVTLYDPWTSPELKDQPYVFAVENSTTTGLPDPMTAFYRDPLSVTIVNGATATGDDKVVSLQKVQAKGIFGDVKWYIDMEGTLHIGSGTFGEPDDSAEMTSPWMVYNDIIDDVIIDGSVIANTDSTALFGGLDTESISGLENIDVSNVTDMGYMFSQMTNLSKLDLSSWDTSSVTNMTAMFAQNNFSNVDLGTWETENVTDMSYMFAMTPNLTSLATPNWNTEKVTTMIGMFTSASALTELDFTGWNTSNVTDMTMMLEPMDPSMPMALKKVTFDSTFATSQLAAKAVELPNTTDSLKWQNLAGGTDDAPKGTEFLTAYASVVPDTYVLVDTITDAKILYNDSTDSNVATKTKATQALSGKIGETETVDLYDPWTSPELKDQKYVFAVEKNATTGLPDPMTAFSRDPLSVTFQTTTDDDEIVNLQPVQAKGIFGDVKWYIDMKGTLHIGSGTFASPVLKDGSAVSPWNDYTKIVNNISIEGNVTANEDSSALFQGFKMVTEISGLDKLDVSNVKNMDHLFYELTTLKTLDISSWDTTNVTNMSNMFRDLQRVPEITFGDGWDTTNVTKMDYMFAMMPTLSKINLEGWNTSNVTTMEGMFIADMALTTLDFSSFDTNNVTDMTAMFAYLVSLNEVTFGENFKTENVAFSSNDYGITEDANGQVVLPNTTDEPTVTRWQNVGDGTVAAPTGDQHLSAYAGAVPDTYVLTSGTIKPILPDTGSDQRLIALISASALIVLGLLGVVWYKRKDSEIER
ncbi:BspA family leucine-rich repeat surface protein [Enterococcus xiangfangensis]|uniref:BspA family leucine-rich repeat surface protein n=1 Tax=Enterococcus xiangfangensis TaxID=1296537 RepID=A0ABU3F871_9ENTE|nr:BspA family leucine-rich repeat surface protein [Enterococcus xiangfangensis]MDT2758869.1 BspA family leucine-rich repeat surface protein [Enterococcus xiangfangensis]